MRQTHLTNMYWYYIRGHPSIATTYGSAYGQILGVVLVVLYQLRAASNITGHGTLVVDYHTVHIMHNTARATAAASVSLPCPLLPRQVLRGTLAVKV